jgi:ATP-dependent DNA helicase PIF1
MAALTLSLEQETALSAFKAGQNVFLTGPGGTGKSALIKLMVEHAKEQKQPIQVCALTGCAALLLNCNAKTIHSWAGIGLAAGPTIEVIRKVCTNKFKAARWQMAKVLIIDEVSMMSAKIFEILDQIGRRTRGRPDLPFGGLQVIFSGDFFQLPPVQIAGGEKVNYCFEHPNWIFTFSRTVQLEKIFRQGDPVYTKILNQIRRGRLGQSAYDTLSQLVGKPLPGGDLRPTILLPGRNAVNALNAVELQKLPEPAYTFQAAYHKDPTIKIDRFYSDEERKHEYDFMVEHCMADKDIVLKVGAQVMCIANLEMQGLVNGSQGIVVDISSHKEVRVKFNDGLVRVMSPHTWLSQSIPDMGLKQLPLILAWAITIHKAQGVSLDMAQIDAGDTIFEHGQTYVALSRVKSLAGLYLKAFNPQRIKVDKVVVDYYASLQEK